MGGLLYHDRICGSKRHCTDTAGYADHVFALMHLLGFRFASRIRDLKDTKLYVPKNSQDYPALQSMIGGNLNIKSIQTHWDEILRLAASIKQDTVTASLMQRKLGSYPRQNGLAVALRELGSIERTLFILDWLQNMALRRRFNARLNKGEARNALAKAFFLSPGRNLRSQLRATALSCQRPPPGDVGHRPIEHGRFGTSRRKTLELDKSVDDALLQYLSPLGWEHINLTGDYVWRQNR